jgi:hypothetical protein
VWHPPLPTIYEVVSFWRSKNGVNFDALDNRGEPGDAIPGTSSQFRSTSTPWLSPNCYIKLIWQAL